MHGSGGMGKRRFVTVLACDVAGLQEAGDDHPTAEAVRSALAVTHDELTRHGAVVQEDPSGVLATFGLPLVHEHDAWRAVHAALQVRTALAQPDALADRHPDARVALRIGISSGLVTTPDGGNGHPVSAAGPVLEASRLRRAARTVDILMTTLTHELVKHAVRAEAAVLFPDGSPMPPMRALRLRELLPGGPARRRHFDSPMIGRRWEQMLLVQLLERAIEDQTCQLFTIFGDPGIGKSRLAEEFAETVADRATTLRGRCLWYGEGITFWPLKTVAQAGAGLLEDDGPEQVHEKLAASLGDDPQADAIASQVAQVLGIADPTGPQEQAFWSVRRWLEAMARKRPLVLIFDDVQWAEKTFLDLVDHVADYARDAPIVVGCLARRADFLRRFPGWGAGRVNSTSILLEPLKERESRQLLTSLVGDEWLGNEASRHIGARAEGNPLFVEEMLGMLVDDGLLRQVDGQWRLQGDLWSVDVPPGLQALLAGRLDRLPETSRTILECASVIGRVFYRSAIAWLVPPDVEPQVDGSLLALIRGGFIRQMPQELLEDETYQFRHPLMLDTSYAALEEGARADLHTRFARWLEQVLGQRAREVDDIIGYHLERAYRYRMQTGQDGERAHRLADDAAERLARAGQKLFHLGDVAAATALLTRAKDLKRPDDTTRLPIVAQLGQALRVGGQFRDAESVLTETIDGAAANQDHRLEQSALIELAFVRLYTDPEGKTTEALERAQQAMAVFQTLGDDRQLAEAWNLVAVVHLIRCEMGERKRAFERALVHAQRSGDQRNEAWIRWGIISSMAYGPDPIPDVIAFAETQLEQARAKGNRVLEAGAIVHLGRLLAMRGRFTEAREHVQKARLLCEDLGLRSWAAVCWQMSGFVESLAGDAKAARRDLEEEYATLERLEERSYLATSAAYRAQVLYDIGQDDDEVVRLTQVTENQAATDDVHAQILWRGARAKALARQDRDPTAALALAQQAADLARPLDDWNTRAGALMDLAETMYLCDRRARVDETAVEAIQLYEAKGNLVAADRARRRHAGWT